MKYKDVDSYIISADPISHSTLREIREIILKSIPDVNESISYNVPFYKFNGVHVGFGAFKKHATFGIGADVLSDKHREKLKKLGYQTGKETVQIKYDQEVPTDYLRLLLEEKISKAKDND
ncbi:iron chaperone [Ekhidna sp.]|uniref:iron chaperone n=1 Tax=Ekhidna sp. TaxID=2608089 RepID=UPI003C7D0F98